jgi:hypothetical protein
MWHGASGAGRGLLVHLRVPVHVARVWIDESGGAVVMLMWLVCTCQYGGAATTERRFGFEMPAVF